MEIKKLVHTHFSLHKSKYICNSNFLTVQTKEWNFSTISRSKIITNFKGICKNPSSWTSSLCLGSQTTLLKLWTFLQYQFIIGQILLVSVWIQQNDKWTIFVGNKMKEICKLTHPHIQYLALRNLNLTNLLLHDCNT